MIKTVFFDFDGVLVESVDIKTLAFAELYAKEGAHIVAKVVDYHVKHTGVSRFDKFAFIYKNFLKRPLSQSTFDSLCKRFSALVLEKIIVSPYVVGAYKFLEAFSGKLNLYIVTATPQAEIEVIIKKRGMQHYFKAVYGAPLSKLDAVARVLKEGAFRPEDCVYIGDAVSDYNAARVHNVAFIGRLSDPAVFKNVDCVKIKDLRRLAATIKRLAV